MSDDITFCGSECNNKKCFRHPSNIAEPNIPHSFAYLKDTDMCPMKKQEIRLIDANKLEEELKEHHDFLLKAWGDTTVNMPKEDKARFDEIGNCIAEIINAPTVEINDKSLEIAQKSIELGRKLGRLEGRLEGKAERPQGDLISRSALLKAMEEERQYLLARGQTGAEHILVHHCLPIIDNAPTVDISKEVWENANELLEKRLTYLERPKVEWIHYEEYTNDRPFYITECPFCKLRVQEETNFCPNCGADMRGDANGR